MPRRHKLSNRSGRLTRSNRRKRTRGLGRLPGGDSADSDAEDANADSTSAATVALARRLCANGNEQACETLERLCESGHDTACNAI